MGSDLVELTAVIAECAKLREKVMSLEEEKFKFEERYDLLAGEKASMEDQVTRLDAEVERLSHHVETLTVEKKALEE